MAFSTDGLEITEYAVSDFDSDAASCEVVYTNSDGFVHSRSVNIPRLADNSVNQDLFDEILYSQLLNVNNKAKIGVAVFQDPNAVEAEDDSEMPITA